MRYFKISLPIIILVMAFLIAFIAHIKLPTTKQVEKTAEPELAVEISTLYRQDYSIKINSYGKIEPNTRTELTAQVSGKIISIGKNFEVGAYFSKGEVLVQLEDSDYIANIKIAKANLILAQQKEVEEQARSEQAKEDWKRLGQGQLVNDLVLRIPQLETAKANLLSAEAELLRAEIALERTKLSAPYDGRIVKKLADIGQFVSSSTVVASIYSTDLIEIRLPIKNNELSLLTLPSKGVKNNYVPVTIQSGLSNNRKWDGHIDRAESQVDSSSQQLNFIAQIDSSFKDANNSPIIGQYATVSIQGKQLKDVIVIPTNNLYQGSYVYIEKEGRVYRKNIEIYWQNENDTIVSKGLENKDHLVITPLGLISSGTAVKITSSEVSPNSAFMTGDNL